MVVPYLLSNLPNLVYKPLLPFWVPISPRSTTSLILDMTPKPELGDPVPFSDFQLSKFILGDLPRGRTF